MRLHCSTASVFFGCLPLIRADVMPNVSTLGAVQRKNSKNPSLLWKWVGGSRSHPEFFFLENHPKIALTSTDISVCILLEVVSYYDLSVLSMSVMGFKKKFGCGWVGELSSIQVYFGFFNQHYTFLLTVNLLLHAIFVFHISEAVN